jgi:hypothetical protein
MFFSFLILSGLHQVGTPSAADRILAVAHSNSAKTAVDEFAEVQEVPELEGEPFVVSYRLESGNATGKDAVLAGFYQYANNELRFHISPEGPSFFQAELMPYKSVTRRIGSFTGRNAFGVSGKVTHYSQQVWALALIEAPDVNLTDSIPDNRFAHMMPSVAASMRLRAPRQPNRRYEFSKSVAGPEAKALIQAHRVEISGTISKLPNGMLSDCKRLRTEATLRSGEQVDVDTCWVGASVESIRIIDARDGETIKQWVSSPLSQN